VYATHEGKDVGREWKRRVSSEYKQGGLYFRPEESPINTFKEDFKTRNQKMILALSKERQAGYLELTYHHYSNEDFQIGSGFVPYPDPPSFLFYPYRKFSLWIALIGLVLYVFIPRKKKRDDALRYPLWRIMAGDFVSLLLIVPFFSFPILLVGGSFQVFEAGWPLIIFLWPIFFIGIWVLKLSAWFASYQVAILNDRLWFSTYTGVREFLYKDMEHFQPVIFKPPRWLIFLSWIAVFSAKGATRIGAAGRAMILSGTAYRNIGIRFRDGSNLYINKTDQIGGIAFEGAEIISKALKEAGVSEKPEPEVVRSLGFQTVRFPEKK
jgi:hypothetical protein